MSGARRFVGEGQLSWMDTLGGKGVLFPLAGGVLVIGGLAAFQGFEPIALALGALVPIWFAWRSQLPQALVRALRHGRPAFRVELDEANVRNFDGAGRPTSELEWFELERYQPTEHGLLLVMRIAKNGANAVFVPKAFFSVSVWPEILALVREKLPGSAKAHDDVAAQASEQRARARRQLVPRLLLIVALFGLLYWLLSLAR